jgi:protein-tyrosine phosphatase
MLLRDGSAQDKQQEFDTTMIDIHNHLLPAIDDGPSKMTETMQMCRIAAADGIRTIVATPHSFNGVFVNEPAKIKFLVGRLNENLSFHGIDLKIVPGMEIRIVPNMMELLASGKLLALNEGRFFLVEFPMAHVPAAFDRFIADLNAENYHLVICHPEKNLHIQKNPDWLARISERVDSWDLLVQISADSIAGLAGRVAYATARQLLKKNLVHVIATDAHSSVIRPPKLSDAVAAATKIVGEQRAHQMVVDIPAAVLTGTGFPRLEALEPPKKWWKLF